MAGILVSGGSIAFDEYPGISPKITFDRDKVRIERSGTIDWDDITAAYSECHPSGALGRHPTVSYLYVDSVSITPKHPEEAQENCSYVSGILTYPGRLANVTITYAPVDFDVDAGPGNDTYITYNRDFGGEYMTRPTAGLVWDDDDSKVQNEDIHFVKTIPLIEHSITVHRAASLPSAAIQANIGMVNDGVWQGAADESLLFMGAKSHWSLSASGDRTYQIDYRFQERRIVLTPGGPVFGWNYYFRNSDGTWQKIKDDAGNYSYVASSSFDDLFSF